MPLDFALTPTGGLGADMSYEIQDSIKNNLVLSLIIDKGSWWFDPDFGSELYKLKREKALPRVVALAQQYSKDALQWLLDTGRAKNIDVTAELDDQHRLCLQITAVQADGQEVSFEIFTGVF